MCGCGQAKVPPSTMPNSMLSASGNFTRPSVAPLALGNDKTQMVTIEYVGTSEGTFTIRSRVSREVSYRFGNNEFHRTHSVFLGDAEWLIGQTDGQGNPTYRILSNASVGDVKDPASFVGQPLVAA